MNISSSQTVRYGFKMWHFSNILSQRIRCKPYPDFTFFRRKTAFRKLWFKAFSLCLLQVDYRWGCDIRCWKIWNSGYLGCNFAPTKGYAKMRFALVRRMKKQHYLFSNPAFFDMLIHKKVGQVGLSETLTPSWAWFQAFATGSLFGTVAKIIELSE